MTRNFGRWIAFASAPGRFDLVVLDLAMPRLGGDEALAEMLALRSDVTALLMTGSVDVDAFVRCRITSYNVCYTKLLRSPGAACPKSR